MKTKRIKILLISSLGISLLVIIGAFLINGGVRENYFWQASLSLPFLFLAYNFHRRLKKSERRLRLAREWGITDLRKRDFEEIGLHFRMTTNEKTTWDLLDDRTWDDLDMNLIYSRIDRTLSVPGEQVLYTILRRPLFDAQGLLERDRWIRLLSQNEETKNNLRYILDMLGRKEGQQLAGLLWGNLPEAAIRSRLLYIPLVFIPALFVFALTYHPWAWFGLLAVFILNMAIHYIAKRATGDCFATLRYLGSLIFWAGKLARLDIPLLREKISALAQNVSAVSALAKRTTFLAPGGNDAFYDYINILFLTEVRAFNRIIKLIERNRQGLKDIFEQVGSIDAMLAIGSYRAGAFVYCCPFFKEFHPILEFDAAVHPLLEMPTPNSLSLNSGGALITGSNMSGKTTFLKMVGVNAVFAQTIVTCSANQYQTSIFRVRSLIGRQDNLIEGKSYYLDEIQSLLKLLKSGNDSAPHLYLLDELFRGTNSAERIASSIEILHYLGKRKGYVLASTHDLEITELIGPGFANYHFREEIGEEGIAFNYKLLSGPSTTRNAIKLLRHVGYPQEIVEAAEKRLESLAR